MTRIVVHLSIALLFLLSLVSCGGSCDCSYENYNKISLGMSKTKVEKILGMSPTSEQMDEYYKSDGSGIVALGSEIASINCEYRCETDVIHVTFRSSTKKVVSKSFN